MRRKTEDRSQKSGFRSQKAFAFWFLAAVFCLLFPCLAHAANFTATVDRTEVSVGEQIQLTLRCEDMPSTGQPQLPPLDGFSVAYGGAQTQVSIDNGVRHDAVAHVFLLTPAREGTLVIPAFNLQLGNQVFSSQPIVIKVAKGQIQGVNTEDVFQLKLSTARTNLFLNEMVPLDLKLSIRNGIRYRSQMPSIAAAGFSEIKLPRPVESQEVIDGKSFVVYTFRTLASPMQVGQLALGPAQAALDVFVDSGRRPRLPGINDPFFENFFGGGGETKRITVTSPAVPVRVSPLPDAGRPADFTGAVGRYALDVTAKPTTLRTGEPVTLTIRVVGQGNLATLAPPKFTPPEGFKSYEPVVKGKQTDEMGYTGEKIFEQVIVPLSVRASVIPPVTFSFFEPEQGRYQTLSRGPIQLNVQESPAGATPVVVGVAPAGAAPRPPEKLGVGVVYLKPDLGAPAPTSHVLYRQTWFLAGQGAPVLALVISLFAQRRRERLRRDIRYARKRRAYGNAQRRLAEAERLLHAGQSQGAAFYATLFKTLQDYLGDRLNLPSSGITSNIIEEQLRPRALPPEICQALKEVFTACDAARFAPNMQGKVDRERLVKIMREVIVAMEKLSL
ncbi:MAG: BatD family protein [Verrucomicrobiia bacterium]